MRSHRFLGINANMRYLEFRDSFHDLILFNTHELLVKHPEFHINRLSEWKKKGYLIGLRKGYYIFADIEINHYIHFLIANTIYQPSYISLETALSYHNLIPEIVYTTTSVSTRLPKRFENAVGVYTYNQIKPTVFQGYHLLPIPNHTRNVKVASPEKAILDTLYFHPQLTSPTDFLSLRLNNDILNRLDLEHLRALIAVYGQKSLARKVDSLLKSYGIFRDKEFAGEIQPHHAKS